MDGFYAPFYKQMDLALAKTNLQNGSSGGLEWAYKKTAMRQNAAPLFLNFHKRTNYYSPL